MCIGTPMRLVSITGTDAVAERGGRHERIDVALLDAPAPCDHVLVFLGAARRIMTADEAALLERALGALADPGADIATAFPDLMAEPTLPPHLELARRRGATTA